MYHFKLVLIVLLKENYLCIEGNPLSDKFLGMMDRVHR